MDLFQINVEDINDHKPVFEETAYTTEVRESVSVGSTVITVRASDKDAGKNGEILYSIKTQSSKPDVFRIDPKTGVISTRLPLDREKEASHSLVIEATDQVYTHTVNFIPINNKVNGSNSLNENRNYLPFYQSKTSLSIQNHKHLPVPFINPKPQSYYFW